MSRWAWLCLLVLTFACGAEQRAGSPNRRPVVASVVIPPEAPREPDPPPPRPDEALGPLPIYQADARIGRDDARITIVAFMDLQCPFCARARPTLEALRKRYGADLRIVFKHNPLPFHKAADEAAIAAITIVQTVGNDAAVEYMDFAFEHQRELTEDSAIAWGRRLHHGLGDRPEPWAAEQLARDQDLAREVGARGTPTFFVNGVRVTGAQPEEKFVEVIDGELAALSAAPTAGDEPIHVARVRKNYTEKPPTPSYRPSPAEDEDTVWKVPLGGSPVLGSRDALVTIVEFGDYQCPFCARVQPTLEAVQAKYGTDVRIVFKHNPLPFHKRADPAARLAIEVFRLKGNDAFWRISADLFSQQRALEDSDLVTLGAKYGLKAAHVKLVLGGTKHKDVVAADQALAMDLEARGTPQFFVNGRRLRGAQPLEKFEAVIDRALAEARALAAGGTPRKKIYETIQRDAKTKLPADVVRLQKIPSDRPSRGPASAPVTIQMFSDFQCPFCKRVVPTIEQIEKQFGGKVRVVWRNLPLPFHGEARGAANAALEVRAQRGNAAFWKFYALLFEEQKNLGPGLYVRLAQKVGANPAQVTRAVSEDRHGAIIDDDAALAASYGIRGTPGFLIGPYFLSGAQPVAAFERLVRLVLEDRRLGRTPTPTRP